MDIPRLKGVEYLEPGTPNLRGGPGGVGEKRTGREGVSWRRSVYPHRAMGATRQNWDRLIRILGQDSTPP